MAEASKEKKSSVRKYVLYVGIVLVATAISLMISLWGEKFGQVVNAFSQTNFLYVLIIIGCVAFSYIIDALIIKVFCRLYTADYKFHQGLANSLIGTFYSDVTPGASGGQIMQAYTLKQQGIQVSNAASIFVMWFILYQTALILFDVVAFIVERNVILSIKSVAIGSFEIPTVIFIIAGFLLNVVVIMALYLMSFSHKFHNFILHYGIGLLAKLRILKNPDKTRESLRVQVENFKIELRRLQANIPVTILITTLFFFYLFAKNCIPYFAGLALNAYQDMSFSVGKMFDAAFLSGFHQMVTGLIPIPGSAGISELFFEVLFFNFFDGGTSAAIRTANVSSAQILWRTATFHIPLVVSGLVAAFYKAKPKEKFAAANRKTFVNLQLETYEERKRSSDTMYETAQISRREIQRRLFSSSKKEEKKHSSRINKQQAHLKDIDERKNNDHDDWETIDINL